MRPALFLRTARPIFTLSSTNRFYATSAAKLITPQKQEMHHPYRSPAHRDQFRQQHPPYRRSPHPTQSSSSTRKQQPRLPVLDPPIHDAEYLKRSFNAENNTGTPLKQTVVDQPKNALSNFCQVVSQEIRPVYDTTKGQVVLENGSRINVCRAKVTIALEEGSFNGYGDGPTNKIAETNAALHLCQQLHLSGMLQNPPRKSTSSAIESVTLSDGSTVSVERARSFMDYYCRRYNFGAPDIVFNEQRKGGWEAVMSVGSRRIGIGQGTNKKQAQAHCFLDVTQYLETCDPDVWKSYVETEKKGGAVGMAPKVFFNMSDRLDDEIRDLLNAVKRSSLYMNRPATTSALATETKSTSAAPPARTRRYIPPDVYANKSRILKTRLDEYRTNPTHEKMRNTRASLPVYTRHDEVLKHIEDNDVTILMAATGSGKTTQIPQIILDSYIDKGEGAKCNVLCTQPRRLAAISVADRVAKERGEKLGQSVGYQVRFEHKFPEEHGSVTFCTTGVFLKKMQTALQNTGPDMDSITHIVVDEVHERDVDTDLLLVVLKRLMADRKARGVPLKVVLMSATIDPTLFQEYLPDDQGRPASVLSIPGRSFPVEKHFMDEYLPQLMSPQTRWVFNEENVQKYIVKELGEPALKSIGVVPSPRALTPSDDLELPYPLIALTISHVLQRTDSGHVLVFLPGWDEIMAVQRIIQSPLGSLGLKLNDSSKYSLHLLHSTIPLAEQQVIFEPPPEGIRRIILSTNIAETSVTIPDVVYVIDTGKIKEQRYDPDRHMSSLVSAWVGSSNLNQRAGRAGRHRPGEYFGVLGSKRAQELAPYQTVEMKRVDLSNVVMHVKALNFPGMSVEEVLAATIEPPASDRVAAAITELQRVGALDPQKGLTSLGRVLLQLPIDPQMGRLVLFGSFFRCLDQALTLAAILTNRDPFLSPMHLKNEAAEVKASWSPQEFRSDALATLRAYNQWSTLQSQGRIQEANRFCIDNFLAKPTLFMIQKIRHHILQALYRAGVIAVSGGGMLNDAGFLKEVPPELNINHDSLPLLAALITIASQPKFAIRTGTRTLRTDHDKTVFIHPSSVNSRKRAIVLDNEPHMEKQLFAFMEKRRNVSTAGSLDTASTYIVNTTRIDPMTYLLFGAYKAQVTPSGIDCDDWLPITGNLDALDDIERLKTMMEGCMLRVFEGITMGNRSSRHARDRIPILRREEESESGDEDDENDMRDYSLSPKEVKELDLLTRDTVRVLNKYAEERMASQSRANSRPATPFDSPSWSSGRLPPSGVRSGYATPQGTITPFGSRPGTPSRLARS